MSQELKLLQLVCQRLDKADISYMLTGSFAANFYAVPRMTRDIDIVLEIQEANVDTLLSIFESDFYIDRYSIVDAIKHQSMFNIIHNETVFKVDFIIRKDANYRNVEFLRRRRMRFGESDIWIVSPEDLIISKLYWARDSLSDMQIRDVKNVLSSINKNIDMDYLIDWIEKLKLGHVYERVLQDA